MPHAFAGKTEQRPATGEVLSVGQGTIAVRVGATVLRNVPVAPPLAVENIEAGDQVALLWHGERAYATAVLNREASVRQAVSSSVTTVITRTISEGGGTGVSDHGALTGLSDDDHTHYLTEGRHDTTTRHGSAVVDHGSIGGLTDDDHTQYAIVEYSATEPASPRTGMIWVDTDA